MIRHDIEIAIKLRDKVSAELKQVNTRLQSLQGKLHELENASQKFALALGAVATGVGFLGKQAIDAAADAEQTMIAFETMLGSAERAQKFFQDLVEFAAKTPFELKGLENAAKQLLAFGIQAENVLPDLKALGDIAAGVGQEKLPHLILAFGQVAAKGRLMGQELLQFTEAGVPLAQELAKQFGVSTAQIQEMISKGEVGFEDVRKALRALTDEGGRFNNLMERQSQSLNGMISNLRDVWDTFLRQEGAQLLEWAKVFVQLLIRIVQILPQLIDQVRSIVAIFREWKEGLIVIGAILGALLVPTVMGLIVAIGALIAQLAPLMLGGFVVGGIVAGVVSIVRHFDLIKEIATEAFEQTLEVAVNTANSLVNTFVWLGTTLLNTVRAAQQALIKVINALALQVYTIINGAITAISQKWNAAWNSFTTIVNTAWNKINGIINSAIDWLNRKIDAFMARLHSVINVVGGVRSFFSGATALGRNIASSIIGMTVPPLAEGGIITKPTLALVGEGGEPEAVIPLSRLRNMGGVVINISGNTFVGEEDFADKVSEVLARKLRMFELL